eukprot:gene11281-553_t
MSDLSALVARLEAVAGRLESAASGSGGGGGGGGGGGSGGASVEAYDEILNTEVKAYLDSSTAIGGDVATQAELVNAAFQAQRAFLVVVGTSKKPSDSVFQSLISATSKAMMAVSEFKEKNFRSKQSNHLSGVAEGLGALGWVTVSPKPAPYVKEMASSGEFYINRVIKDMKDTDKSHVPVAANPTVATGAAKGGLFAELSKGGAVTSGLEKVDKSEMTHKNPGLRKTAVVSAGATAKKAPAKVFGSAAAKVYDPVFELQGKKWVVEHQKDNRSIVIEAEGVNQLVYIYKCTGSTIQIKGKVAAITMDGCKKSAVVFENCVAAFELINCQSVQAQTTGSVATISIDKTDGAAIYLSKDSIGAEIITAKSSEMNISVPNLDDPEGDMIEMPVPEQFKTTFDPATKTLVTTMTDIAG